VAGQTPVRGGQGTGSGKGGVACGDPVAHLPYALEAVITRRHTGTGGCRAGGLPINWSGLATMNTSLAQAWIATEFRSYSDPAADRFPCVEGTTQVAKP